MIRIRCYAATCFLVFALGLPGAHGITDDQRNLIIVGAACGGAALIALIGGITAACLYKKKAHRYKKQLHKVTKAKEKEDKQRETQQQRSSIVTGTENPGFNVERNEHKEKDDQRNYGIDSPATIEIQKPNRDEELMAKTEVRTLGGDFVPANYYGGRGPSINAKRDPGPAMHQQNRGQSPQNEYRESHVVEHQVTHDHNYHPEVHREESYSDTGFEPQPQRFGTGFPIPRVAGIPKRSLSARDQSEQISPRQVYPMHGDPHSHEDPRESYPPNRFSQKPTPYPKPQRNWQSQKEMSSHRPQSFGEFNELRSQTAKYPMVPLPHKERRDFRGPYGPDDIY